MGDFEREGEEGDAEGDEEDDEVEKKNVVRIGLEGFGGCVSVLLFDVGGCMSFFVP